jgi:aryl-alcohol dehydrogenase
MNITAAVVPVRSAPFEIETLDLAAPLADEVLVRVVASGMCHTDLHARDGYFPNLPYPVVCGHEGAGIIEQVGADVADLAPGDPVVISFPWCGECGPCRAERISYCERARPLKSSGRRADGSIPMSRNGEPVYSCFFQQSSFASFAVAPAKDVVKIRRDAPIEMLGPLGCGLQIVFRRPGGTPRINRLKTLNPLVLLALCAGSRSAPIGTPPSDDSKC